MPATVEQTTIDQVSAPEPTIRFEESPSIIKATVIVFPPAAPGGDPIFENALVTIPGSGSPSIPAHTVLIWELVDGVNAFDILEFHNVGFGGVQFPIGLTLWDSGVVDVGPKKRLVFIKNQVLEPSQFSYTVDINYRLPSGELLQASSPDPTIVVATEPIDG
ncbi:MAG TPA: hypothetical protein VLT87_29205 [Thermoanaerobaculia bacterium]|nr:hypothetical protein [Thermoanaerobaculia bacterium]